jgi:phosphate:Na+ symporter
MLNNSAANAAARRVALGSLLFKLVGSLIILPFVHPLAAAMHKLPLPSLSWLSTSTSLQPAALHRDGAFAGPMAKLCQRMIRDDPSWITI